jgi:adenylate kinase family enzyme
MQRISIVGSTGSGKSTLARQLAARLNLKAIEIDALFWLPEWTNRSLDELACLVSDVTASDRWVIDGNYSSVRPIVWGRADTVVWLDYAFPIVFGRLVRRTILRLMRNELLWGCNKESVVKTLSRDSILLWCIHVYARHRREYADLFERPEYAHLEKHRFRTLRQTDRWLRDLR